MEDGQIVELYWAREEAAITESEKKYGAYCHNIAKRVLANDEDAQETLADTWLRAWNTIPPEKPTLLRPFFARLSRNLAIDRWRRNSAEKRGFGLTVALEELSELAGKTPSPQEQTEGKALEETIRVFLSGCTQTQRNVFLRRYFFFESTADIAARYAMRESNVLNILSRTRKKLKEHLQKEGWLP